MGIDITNYQNNDSTMELELLEKQAMKSIMEVDELLSLESSVMNKFHSGISVSVEDFNGLSLTLEGFLKKVWEGITNAIKKVIEFIKKSFNWLKNKITNITKKQKALKEMYSGRHWTLFSTYSGISDAAGNFTLQAANIPFKRLKYNKNLETKWGETIDLITVVDFDYVEKAVDVSEKMSKDLNGFIAKLTELIKKSDLSNEDVVDFTDKNTKSVENMLLKNEGQIDKVYTHFLPTTSSTTVGLSSNGLLDRSCKVSDAYRRPSKGTGYYCVVTTFKGLADKLKVTNGLGRASRVMEMTSNDLDDVIKGVEKLLTKNDETLNRDQERDVKNTVNAANKMSVVLIGNLNQTATAIDKTVDSAIDNGQKLDKKESDEK